MSGPELAQEGAPRGSFRRPGRWLLGFGPRRAAPGVPRAELARGPDEQYILEFFSFYFQKLFEYVFDVFD